MVRKGKCKIIYFVSCNTELFDLHADLEETDREDKDDQNALIGIYGGGVKAIHMGPKSATAVPGQSEE